jgi:hypothetical protein
LLLVPGVENFPIAYRHIIGIIKFSSRVGSHVFLVLFRIKEMGEVSLFEFGQSECGGHLGQGTGKEIVRIDKFQAADF